MARRAPTIADLADESYVATRRHHRNAAELRTAARIVGAVSPRGARVVERLATESSNETRKHLRTERAYRSGDAHAGD